ncbi:hypothetical protein [Demequina gelatinilytica]|uniref:hypothetical protein n=1 Tax=Demequina gelatinilytica TaxID=1638980 RepID=UPI000AE90039|nr:hypothetical protein [Demequina gelatinilytica]
MGLFSRKDTVLAHVPEGFRVAGSFAYQSAYKAHRRGLDWVEHGAAAPTAECVVELRAEPRNQYDARAVAVRLGVTVLGHVPRGHLDWAHRELERAGKARLVANASMLRFTDEYQLLIVASE